MVVKLRPFTQSEAAIGERRLVGRRGLAQGDVIVKINPTGTLGDWNHVTNTERGGFRESVSRARVTSEQDGCVARSAPEQLLVGWVWRCSSSKEGSKPLKAVSPIVKVRG